MASNHNLESLTLIAGSACGELAQSVAALLKIDLCRINTRRFSDGEVYVELEENIRGKNVYIMQSMAAPVNENLMEMLLIADACKRASAAEVVAISPYLGYSRQDRRPRSSRVPISARVVADMIGNLGICRLVTMDLHAEQIQGFYRIPVENIYAMPVLMANISSLLAAGGGDGVVVAPDVGGVVRARAFANALGLDLAIIDKRRPRANVAKVMHIIGDVKGKDCFLVDDIVDTANTLCEASGALKERGARRVYAHCTHPVLSGKAVERVQKCSLEELVVCDTIPPTAQVKNCDKIKVLSVSSILAETISRIYQHESISSLF
jgi:ribose-phosphate pyrophosphokinase